MCTVTLSYDDNNKVAAEKMAALLATGLFVQLDNMENFIDRDLTPEELREVLINDVETFYGVKNAV